MRSKTIALTLLLSIGFSFQNCNPYCDCPPIAGKFFDIQGFDLSHHKKLTEGYSADIPDGSTINFADYHGFELDFAVEYHSQRCPKRHDWGFSLMGSALACSCAQDGYLGSKTEKIESLTVITLNDFDAEHLANDTINDLLEARLRYENIDLNEYLLQDTSLIGLDYFGIGLKKAPELNEDFKVKVILNLGGNEVHEVESGVVKIMN